MNAYYFGRKESLVFASESPTDTAVLELVDDIIKSGEGLIRVAVDSRNDSYMFIVRKKKEGEELTSEEEIIEV